MPPADTVSAVLAVTDGVQTAMSVANVVLCVSVERAVTTVQLYVLNVTKNAQTVSPNTSAETVVRVLIVQVVKATSAWVVRCALTVLNTSATVETVALNAPLSAKDVQRIAKTVRDLSVQNVVFVPIVQVNFGVKTATTVETVWMSAIAEQVVLNVQMSARVVLRNAATVLKRIYVKNVETAEIV